MTRIGPGEGGSVPSPRAVLAWSPEEADTALDRLEATVPVGPGWVSIAGPALEAIVVGDTHGDWPSTLAATAAFLAAPRERLLVVLGDTIDRPPSDCPNGSVANAVYLLSLRAAYPDRVVLLQGNHEAFRRIPCVPHDLPAEVDDLWGPEEERYLRLLGLLERGAWMARLPGGVLCAHAGFPSEGTPAEWADRYARPSEELVVDTVWRGSSESRFDRGMGPPFGPEELSAFLAAARGRLFLRGHDPDLAGRWGQGRRALTLHTTRVYEAYGGVLIARLPADGRPVRADDVGIEHLPTEGQHYPEE